MRILSVRFHLLMVQPVCTLKKCYEFKLYKKTPFSCSACNQTMGSHALEQIQYLQQ